MKLVKAGKTNGNADSVEIGLLQRVAEGDRHAFDDLFSNYYPRLFAFLFRLTHSHSVAEELANDVLFTLWTDAGRFRGESKVSTWIFGIAYRQSLAHFRKRKLKLVPLVEQDEPRRETAGRIEREDWVRQSIKRLPPKQSLTVMLVYFLGLSCGETARATGVPVSTVKTRMFHARKNLKISLAANSGPQGKHQG